MLQSNEHLSSQWEIPYVDLPGLMDISSGSGSFEWSAPVGISTDKLNGGNRLLCSLGGLGACREYIFRGGSTDHLRHRIGAQPDRRRA